MRVAHEQAGVSDSSRLLDSRLRRGISLIEMMVVMTGVATLLGLCVVTIQLLLRLETDSRNRLTATAAIDRLSGQLRADVHAATKAEIGPEAKGVPSALLLSGAAGHSVRYEPREKELVRVETIGNKRVMRDAFVLGAGLTASFEMSAEASGTFVSLLVQPPRIDGEARSSRTLEVLAQVARDERRLARSSADSAKQGGAGQ